MQCLITRKLPILKTHLCLPFSEPSPVLTKDNQPRLTLLWVLCLKVTLLDLPFSHSLPSWTLHQAAVIFFLLLLTFQNIVYFPSAWLMSGEELIQHRHTRQLAPGRAILSLCCWQPRAGGEEAVTCLAVVTAGDGCQQQGWDAARSLAGMALAPHCKTSAGMGQLH